MVSSSVWIYRRKLSRLLWPVMAWIVSILIPALDKLVAKLRRVEWVEIPLPPNPAFSQAILSARSALAIDIGFSGLCGLGKSKNKFWWGYDSKNSFSLGCTGICLVSRSPWGLAFRVCFLKVILCKHEPVGSKTAEVSSWRIAPHRSPV